MIILRCTHVLTLLMTSAWCLLLQADPQLPAVAEQHTLSYDGLAGAACPAAPQALKKTISNALLSAAAEHAVEPALLFAVMRQESRCVPGARSRRGAAGLMQLHPLTARELGVSDPYEVGQNIRAGTFYLATLLRQFDGQIALALAAYNAGPNAVKRYGKIPPYKETQSYVKTVLKNYRRYCELKGLKA